MIQVRPEPCTIAELRDNVRAAAKGAGLNMGTSLGSSLSMLRAIARKYHGTPVAADIADVMGEPELANQPNPLEVKPLG